MNRTPLEVIELSGTPLEIAWKLGVLRGPHIRRRVRSWNGRIRRMFSPDRARRLERAFLAAAQSEVPRLVEELRAMAEGAGVPFEDLFRFNITELHSFEEKCSTVALRWRASGRGGVLIGHNEDWDPKRNDVFILRVIPDKGPRYVVLAYDGFLAGLSAGFNAAGIYHAVNYLAPTDFRPGVPRIFVTRQLVNAETLDAATRAVTGMRRAFGQSINLARGSTMLTIELTARRASVKRVRFPFVHTNHYLAPELTPWASAPAPSTARRLATARARLAEAPAAESRRAALARTRSVLSDRSGHPYSIWRNADHPRDRVATLATAVMNTASRTMLVWRGRPSDAEPMEVRL